MKLFHCIVVMGAAMGAGCGGRATSSGAPSPSGGGSSGSAGGTFGVSGDDAGCPDSSTTVAFNNGGILYDVGCQNHGPCVGTAEDPQGPAACTTPQQFACGTRAAQVLDAMSPHGCTCVATAPLSPADCPQPYQFQCDDWTQRCGCWCDPGAPASAGDCGDASTYPGKQFTCYSFSPPVGCECALIPPPIL